MSLRFLVIDGVDNMRYYDYDPKMNFSDRIMAVLRLDDRNIAKISNSPEATFEASQLFFLLAALGAVIMFLFMQPDYFIGFYFYYNNSALVSAVGTFFGELAFLFLISQTYTICLRIFNVQTITKEQVYRLVGFAVIWHGIFSLILVVLSTIDNLSGIIGITGAILSMITIIQGISRQTETAPVFSGIALVVAVVITVFVMIPVSILLTFLIYF
jgi:hypothetical protein